MGRKHLFFVLKTGKLSALTKRKSAFPTEDTCLALNRHGFSLTDHQVVILKIGNGGEKVLTWNIGVFFPHFPNYKSQTGLCFQLIMPYFTSP